MNMNDRRTHWALALTVAFTGIFVVETVWSQTTPPPPRLLYVQPSAGQAGTTFDYLIAGQDLDTPTGLHFSLRAVTVEYVGTDSSFPGGQPKGKKGGGRGQPGGLSTHKFKVTLPADAAAGIQDVRVISKGGVSNPRAF